MPSLNVKSASELLYDRIRRGLSGFESQYLPEPKFACKGDAARCDLKISWPRGWIEVEIAESVEHPGKASYFLHFEHDAGAAMSGLNTTSIERILVEVGMAIAIMLAVESEDVVQ